MISAKRPRRKSEESLTQQRFLQWLALQYPKVWAVTASFPNEGKRSLRTGSRMKAEGLKKGMPDVGIFRAVPNDDADDFWYHGMFIEFKSVKGRLTPEQKHMIELLGNQGYYCCVCHTLEEAIIEMKEYLHD